MERLKNTETLRGAEGGTGFLQGPRERRREEGQSCGLAGWQSLSSLRWWERAGVIVGCCFYRTLLRWYPSPCCIGNWVISEDPAVVRRWNHQMNPNN